MAYYDALKAKWATLNGTTQQKLDALNALMVPDPKAPLPCILSSSQVQQAFDPADLTGPLASSPNLNVLWMLLNSQTVDMSKGGNTRASILQIFSGCAATIANLMAMVAPYDNAQTLWWQSVGSNGPVSLADLDMAGSLT